MDDTHAPGGPKGADGGRVERFTASGRATGVLGLILIVGVVAIGLVDRTVEYPLWAYPAAAAAAVLVWAVAVRPGVRVEGDELVLRNMFDTVRLPLAGVEQLAVGRFLAVRVADKRYVGSGLSRSRRQALHDDRAVDKVEQLSYGGWAENRLWALVDDARAVRGIRPASEEQYALGQEVRRERAWVELGLLGLFGTLFVAALVV